MLFCQNRELNPCRVAQHEITFSHEKWPLLRPFSREFDLFCTSFFLSGGCVFCVLTRWQKKTIPNPRMRGFKPVAWVHPWGHKWPQHGSYIMTAPDSKKHTLDPLWGQKSVFYKKKWEKTRNRPFWVGSVFLITKIESVSVMPALCQLNLFFFAFLGLSLAFFCFFASFFLFFIFFCFFFSQKILFLGYFWDLWVSTLHSGSLWRRSMLINALRFYKISKMPILGISRCL